MSRYAKLLSYGADDIGALRKLGSWSLDGIAELSKCLKAFQNLKTLDGSSKEFVQRKFAQLKKKEVIAFPNVLFRKLAKVDELYFLSKSQEVLKKTLSMKTLIDDFIRSVARSHILALIQKELGFRTLDDIAIAYPDKFNEELLDSFSGAVIGKNSNNPKGEQLKKYLLALALGSDFRVKFKYVEDPVNFDLSELKRFETVVFNIESLEETLTLSWNL